jgi:hypothetical protein
MDELWMKIPGFERYSVSDAGRVRNDNTGRIMVIRRTGHGVYYVGLQEDATGLQRNRSLALLVATAFVPNEQGFTTPIHLDGYRSNNRAINLLWRPGWFAKKYHAQFNRPYPDLSNSIICRDTHEVMENMWAACIKYGLLESDLHLSIMNRSFVYPTYQQWEFEE